MKIIFVNDLDGTRVAARQSYSVIDTVVLEHSFANGDVFYIEYISTEEYILRYSVPVEQLH